MVTSVGAVLLSRHVCRIHHSNINVCKALFVLTCFPTQHHHRPRSSGNSNSSNLLQQQYSTLTHARRTLSFQSLQNLCQSRNVINIISPNCWKKSVAFSRKLFSRSFCPVCQSQSCLHFQFRSKKNMCDCSKKRVCIVGSGNWGSAIAKIVGANTRKYASLFEEEVRMYVYEELVEGRKLTEIINEDHENVKYLPGHKLPTNVVAIPDIVDAAGEADIIIFVLPHQFIKATCKPLVGKTKAGAFGVSLIKGFDIAEGGGIDLISHIITRFLSIPCSVLMGANLANEIANESFSETTIGTHDVEQGQVLHTLFQTDFFRVVVVADVETVEICGALKNIVAVGAGFVDGLQYGDNTKAAVIRLGLMEMVRFSEEFYGGKNLSTFLESCGVADLITTCYGGRNRKVSEAFVRTGKTLAQLEVEMLNGQRLQGPMTAAEVHHMLEARGLKEKFPLFTAVHRICIGELKPSDLINCIRNHPEHIASTLSKSSL